MLTRARHADRGFSLVEMMVVVGLLGTVIGVIFGALQVLSTSASTSMEESASAHDLSYSMELLSKALMAGTSVLYADDYRLEMVTQKTDRSYERQSIYATSTPGATRGSLVWTRWSSDDSGTVAYGATPTFNWVVSDRNLNSVAPQVPLFVYYGLNNTTMTATAGGYVGSQVKGIHLHVLVAFNGGVRDDSRDVAPPLLQ
jgi:prepilin-type N-terminal cleavage/methylation domain-containing protein